MEISNVCIAGLDKRMDYVEKNFYAKGYDVYRHIYEADEKSIIIFPPPVNEVVFEKYNKYLKKGQIVYGGGIEEDIYVKLKKITENVFDYLKWEEVVKANAVLTAKGIIKEAILEKAIFQEANCLVTGYGYCGKEIARELKKQGSNVDIAVRRKELKKEIETNYERFVDINDMNKYNLEKYSYVFNTVPAMVLDENVLSFVSRNVMIFDIASKPGGTDFKFCKENGIYAVNSLGIPGKEFPEEAGNIIANGIDEHIISL